MLRTSFLIFAALTVAGTSFADDKLDSVRGKVAAMFDVIEPNDVTASPVDGWYMIRRNSIVAYISEDGRYLLQGDMIDLDANVNLSDIARNESRRELMSSIDDSETIRFSPADPKYSVTIFTDVDCTYCRRLHAQIDEYLESGIEVRYLLYPRYGPSSASWNKSQNVSCSQDKQAALTTAKRGEAVEAQRCGSTMVQEHFALGRQVGLSGTPAIVLGDGELIGGYLPPAQLKQRLDQKASETPGS